ncbi:MAG TPA: hypothetical protein DCQ99_02780 [Nitrospinae bacterium]|nr:hypothetical protein [Nitrospinota bacterium]HBA26519.1 hypothetical protein [Nitrospinota bacterium]
MDRYSPFPQNPWVEGIGNRCNLLKIRMLKMVGMNGGSVTTLASGLDNPNGIAIDSTNVYWAETAVSGTIKKIAK